MGVYEEQIVPIKITRLAEYVSQRKRISLEDALVYIYSNPMYDRLYDEGAKWWSLSTEALYNEFESARIAERRNIPHEEFEFYTYCLEKYAQAKGLTGLQALALLKRYGADDFLIDHYDLLHTQGTGVNSRSEKKEKSVIVAPAAIAELKAYKTYNQLSFHTPCVIQALRLVECYEVK